MRFCDEEDGGRLTIDVGCVDVDGLGGRVISCVKAAVDRGENLQNSFSQAGLEHHTATPHTHILTAWIQVGDAHRD